MGISQSLRAPKEKWKDKYYTRETVTGVYGVVTVVWDAKRKVLF